MSRSLPQHSKRILVAIPTNGRDGQARIDGIIRFMNEHATWRMDFLTDHRSIESFLRNPSGLAGYDGIIAAFNEGVGIDFALLQDFSRTHPLVIANETLMPRLPPDTLRRAVFVDNAALGREAARYLRSLGHFAATVFYHGPLEYAWSSERQKAFEDELGRRDAPEVIVTRPEELGRRLASLPRPIALLAANDLMARDAVNACLDLGLRVPGDVMILGCDNDRISCEGIRPRLSSLAPDFTQVGYQAARALDRLMRKRGKGIPPVRRISNATVVERESTRPTQPATVLVERAVAFIAASACRGIGVKDVAQAVGVSRSLLDLRFRECHGQAVHQAIRDVRFARLSELLRISSASIGHLARECGFNDVDNLMRQFKRRYGCTMSEWRESPLTTPASR